MAITYHPAIQAYFASEAEEGVDVCDSAFTHDAVVTDEGKTISGVNAIRLWKQETQQKYDYAVEPLDHQDTESHTLVRARLSGNFPGSPIVVVYRFGLLNAKINTLEIQ